MSFKEWWIRNQDLYSVTERTAYIIWCAAQESIKAEAAVDTSKWPDQWPENAKREQQLKYREL
jgi:hypothetical protein